MKENHKIKIGITSVLAGGGHNALRDFLYDELVGIKEFQVEKFTHPTKSFNRMNDMLLGKINKLSNILVEFPNEYPTVSVLPFLGECEKFIEEYRPDIILATHFGIATAFTLLRNIKKYNYKIVLCFPDYGYPQRGGLPKNFLSKPDYWLVFDNKTAEGLTKKFKINDKEVMVSGYVASRFTRNVVANAGSRQFLINEINKTLGKVKLDESKETYVIQGGAGGIIHKSEKLLERIVDYQKNDKEFFDNKQFVLICGLNEKFQNKVLERRKKDSNWRNIIPVGWIPREVLTKIQMVSEFPIMITIAPASINELIEAECGPIVVYKTRGGQEIPNTEFIVSNKLGFKIPKENDVLRIINNGFSDKQIRQFEQNSAKYRQNQLNKLANLKDQLLQVFHRKKEVSNKGLKDGVMMMAKNVGNIGVVKKVPWYAFVLVPMSIITSYVLYRKQKATMGKVIKGVGNVTKKVGKVTKKIIIDN